jgi:hypothetical protein
MENKRKFSHDPDLKLSASTQRQALNAIIFLYRHVLDQPIEEQIVPAL